MAERAINPFVKLTLELGPVIAFFIAFGRMKDNSYTFFGTQYSGFITVTAGFIVLMVISSLLLWALTGAISRVQMFSLVLVVIMGGLTVYLNDELFIKMKPTLLFGTFGIVLGFGLWRGRSLLRDLMGAALPLREEGWMILTRRLAAFFLILASANEAIWRFASTETWVLFNTFGDTAALMLFLLSQYKVLEKYGIENGKDSEG